MRSSEFSLNCHQTAFFVVLVLAGQSFAQFHEKVVYNFSGSPDGIRPAASLVADVADNLYGTTADGGVGTFCCGTVFELSPPAAVGGSWSETVLYAFQGGSDGSSPLGTLIFDKLGNLYGTTSGASGSSGQTVFELSPPSTPGGAWTKSTLAAFAGPDLTGPIGKLVMDAAGNLYGTSEGGGSHKKGSVVELVAPKTPGAPWAQRVLYEFGAFAHDGGGPGDLLLRGGILYGTTQGGGTANQGTVFSLARKPGLWTETILHSFTGNEGEGPRGGLIMDGAGNLYGTAQGTNSVCTTTTDCGAIYELSPPAVAGDPWQETTLFHFSSLSTGADPYAALWHNKDDVLYGTTIYGGNGGDRGRNLGTVFKLVPPAIAGGDWTEVVLHYFRGVAAGDGSKPTGALIWSNGAFYGTTEGGGDGSGTVFSLSLAP